MNKKEFERREREIAVSGVSEIASHDSPLYEQQLGCVLDWLFTMFDRVRGKDEKAAKEARNDLNEILLNAISWMMPLALQKQDSIAKKWAGQVFARLEADVKKYGKKLAATNGAYRDWKKTLGKLRRDVLLPTSPVTQIVQRELKKAEKYRSQLLLLKCGVPRTVRKEVVKVRTGSGTGSTLTFADRKSWQSIRAAHRLFWRHHVTPDAWKRAARKRKIPQAYWPTVGLPDFSAKSFPKWWKFLWPLIEKKIKIKLPKLDSRYQMARKRYFSDSEKTAHGHLKTLARLRDKRVLF